MDEEEVIKKPLLSTMKKKQQQLPSWLSEAQVLSLKAALFLGCIYACSAAYNLLHSQQDPPCHCQCQCQEPEPEPEPAWAWHLPWLLRRYVLTGADVVDASFALLRGLLWCSAAALTAAALALALLAGGHSRRGLGVRAAAIVALAATAVSHWIYFRLIGLVRVDSPGDLFLAVETACVVAAAALDLLGFVAFVLGVGGDEQAGRLAAAPRARAG